jgi:2,3-bisphosphoglycerate-independent phosphoglycerate mutase
MKLLFLIADGMGGWADERPGGKTCLEAAVTPNMDALAAAGVVGTCRTIPDGMPPGSDVANMSLLGFEPRPRGLSWPRTTWSGA